MDIAKIFENNQKWIKEHLDEDASYFENLSKGQSPGILYVGCSDSRVTAEQMMGVGPGDVFVHRNIANLVPVSDLNSLAVVEYSVKYLKVKHIVICGHYFCGGVKAAMQSDNLGILNPWLRNIRDVYRMYSDELDAIENEDDRYNKLIERNVEEQCKNLLKTEVVQEAHKERGIHVHGWVFDIKTGKLIDLNVNYENLMPDLKKIYDID